MRRSGRARLACAWGLLCAGCTAVAPHNAMFGQLARPMDPGDAEVALSTGAELQLKPSEFPGTSGDVQVGLPVAAGRVAYGASKRVELELGASAAGLSPGVKIGGTSGRLSYAVLPEVGVGYFHQSSQINLPTNGSLVSVPGENLILTPGIKLLLSHDSGLYAGVSYDFLRHTVANSIPDAVTASSGTDTTAHELTAAVGFSTGGRLIVRPELSVLFCPFQSTTFAGSFGISPQSSSFWAVTTSVTFAIRSAAVPPAEPTVRTPEHDVRFDAPPIIH
ncbi:MAG: hypothetical protein JST54_34410 [Deltaproteobacteria bacterium]|nr:hypothetical protein [Deltaproteobacteria bacterium]